MQSNLFQPNQFFFDKQIALISINNFFAECEILRNPLLKNNSVVVVTPTIHGSKKVISCNKLALEQKISLGMDLDLAKKLSDSKTVFVDVGSDYYLSVSSKFFEIIDFFCESVEQISISEAYLDLTNANGFEKAEELCFKIKQRVFSEIGLKCSIGLSFNKFFSKLALGEKNLNNFFKILPNQKDFFLSKKQVIQVFDLTLFDKKTFFNIGVKSIIDLKKFKLEQLIELFGEIKGKDFYYLIRGVDDRIVLINREKKQISRIMTLKKESRDFVEIKKDLDLVCDMVFLEVQKSKKLFRSCSLIIVNDFGVFNKSKTFSKVLTLDSFKEIAFFLLEEFLVEQKMVVKKIGFKITDFDDDYGFQKKLLEFSD